MTELVREAEGRDGVVRLYGDRVEIAREGLLAKGVHFGQGDRTIPLELVGEATLEKPEGYSAGHLEFLPVGCSAPDGLYDEGAYAVKFVGDLATFEELHATFYRLRPDGPADLAVAPDVDATLEELARKLSKGKISRDEFDRSVRYVD